MSVGGEGFSGDGLCSKHQAENGSFEPGDFEMEDLRRTLISKAICFPESM